MNLGNPAATNDGLQVANVELATGHDLDLTTGAIDQLRERFDAIQRCRTPARREHTFDSQVDQGIECFERRWRLVKGLMKGDTERTGQCNEAPESGLG